MARNGSGTYNRAVSPYTAGTTITAATVNSEMDDIATALTNSMARDGQSPATANIPMGGFRLTGLGNAVASTDAAPLGQVAAKGGDTMTGALGVVAGTVSAPGLFVSGDTNTGLFQPSADTLAVAVGGVEVGRFGANGLQSAAPWVDLASASTTDLGAQTSDNLRITGTTTITAFGTAANGVTRDLRFAGALTLTHNATSLILPGGANITTAAGDTATAKSLGSGNWVVTNYTQAIGLSWQLCEAPRVVSGVASLDFTLPAIFRRYRLTVQDLTVNTAGNGLFLRFSSDGGSTFLTGAFYQQFGNVTDTSPINTPFATGSTTSIALSSGLQGSSMNGFDGTYEITPGSASMAARVRGNAIGVNSTPSWIIGYWGGAWTGTLARMNAIRLNTPSGNLSGTFILEGMR